MNEPRYIFFIGGHRTGSKALATFADSLPNTSCIHQNTAHQLLNLISYAYLHGVIPKYFFHKCVDWLLINRLKRMKASYIVETNGFNMVALERVLDSLGTVKIVHVVRDPRTFVISMKNWRSERKVRNFIQENLPFWSAGPHLLKMSRKEWKNKSVEQKFAHRWVFKNNYIKSTYGSLKNYKMIKFEDLFNSENIDNIQAIFTWAEMDLSITNIKGFIGHKVNNSATTKKQSHWSKWPECKVKSLNEICLPCDYGYLNDEKWLNIVNNKKHELSNSR